MESLPQEILRYLDDGDASSLDIVEFLKIRHKELTTQDALAAFLPLMMTGQIRWVGEGLIGLCVKSS